MKVEKDLHMATGDGEYSYAANSSTQEMTILETRPLLRNAIEEVYTSLAAGGTMVVADLGCSSGPNALLLISEVIGTINDNTHEQCALEVQFFLNDLPGNDFNLVFQSLEHVQNLAGKDIEKGVPGHPGVYNPLWKDMVTPPYYIAGLPGSFYGRLFPQQSVHLFYSSFCLMWRSKVPEELSNGTHLNEGNIYIGKTTPPVVIKLFQEQFKNDFQLFLKLRYKELVCGGRMLLTFMGRKGEEMLMHGEVGNTWELLSKSLQSLVLKGRVEKDKLTSFNLPFYAPSLDEVMCLINENKLFDMEHIKIFEPNWDPQDKSEGDVVLDCASGGANVAKAVRAVIEPLILKHFGEDILDELFLVYESMVAKHLEKAKAKNSIVMVSLKKTIQ